MHDARFATDPHQVYDQLREHAPAGPVELAPGVDATLVVGHEMALRVLQNTELFARDARRWKALNEGRIALDNPVLPMIGVPAELSVHRRRGASAAAQGRGGQSGAAQHHADPA
ncbi:hypothetical protein SALBM217S_01218 [Streptomyces griseoloalbus]